MGGTRLVPSSSMLTSRVESVCKARCVRSSSSRVLPIRSAEFMLFWGCLASTCGLGFFDHSSAVTIRCSSSRTLVKYSSTFSRSGMPSFGCIRWAWSRTVSRMLWPSRRRRAWAWTSSGRPSRNSRANTVAG